MFTYFLSKDTSQSIAFKTERTKHQPASTQWEEMLRHRATTRWPDQSTLNFLSSSKTEDKINKDHGDDE
jgi:hypothetical protein